MNCVAQVVSAAAGRGCLARNRKAARRLAGGSGLERRFDQLVGGFIVRDRPGDRRSWRARRSPWRSARRETMRCPPSAGDVVSPSRSGQHVIVLAVGQPPHDQRAGAFGWGCTRWSRSRTAATDLPAPVPVAVASSARGPSGRPAAGGSAGARRASVRRPCRVSRGCRSRGLSRCRRPRFPPRADPALQEMNAAVLKLSSMFSRWLSVYGRRHFNP